MPAAPQSYVLSSSPSLLSTSAISRAIKSALPMLRCLLRTQNRAKLYVKRTPLLRRALPALREGSVDFDSLRGTVGSFEGRKRGERGAKAKRERTGTFFCVGSCYEFGMELWKVPLSSTSLTSNVTVHVLIGREEPEERGQGSGTNAAAASGQVQRSWPWQICGLGRRHSDAHSVSVRPLGHLAKSLAHSLTHSLSQSINHEQSALEPVSRQTGV